MAAVTIRNLPDEVLRALKVRAQSHGLSTEAEIRQILQEVATPPSKLKIGSELVALGRRYGGIELTDVRDRRPPEPADFE